MDDMIETIMAKADQLTADDLIGRTITIKITGAKVDKSDQPVSLSYDGDGGKPFKPGKSMRRVLSHVWGTDSKKYVGRQLTLYRDPAVKFGGQEVGGIRISHMSDIKSAVTVSLTASKGNKKPYVVKPLAVASTPSPTPAAAADPEKATLIKDGEAAVAAGWDAYKAWGSKLTPEQKDKIKEFLPKWTVDAKKVGD